MIVVFLIAAFPLLVYAKNHWENFTSRANFLFIGHQIKRAESLVPLWNNLKTTALLFNYRANGNDFFIDEPLVDKPVSWLFPLGLLITVFKVFREKRKNYLFMLLFFIAFLIPGILSVPNGNRAIGTLPIVYFLAALGLVTLAGKKKVSLLIIALFLSVITIFSYRDYLSPNRRELPGFYPETYVTLEYLKKIENYTDYDFYFTDNYPRELLTFLLYQPGQKNPFSKNYVWLERNVDFLDVIKKPGKAIAFVMFVNYLNQQFADTLIRKYPGAEKIYLRYINGKINRPASIIIFVSRN